MNSSNSILPGWNLNSKTFVVTGGTKGIGYATAQSLLSHGASKLMICARGKDDCEKAVGLLKSEFGTEKEIYNIPCDISTQEGRTLLVEGTRERFGDKLDGLVNNVGMNVRKDLTQQQAEEYHQMIRTNVDSVYFLCKDFKDMLSNAGQGASVVNVASAAGVQSSGTGAAYGLSKAAVIHFSKILACEWAQLNIRVNSIAPWMTMTPMLEEAVKANPSQLDKVKDWTPMHRLGTVEEVAAPIAFLLMPCSSYITGQCLGIDGGLTAQAFDGPCVTPP